MRKLLALAVLAAATPAHAAWNYDEVVDPITDARRPIISLKNDAGDIMVLKCDEPGQKQVYVQLLSRKYLGGGGIRSARRQLIYRFDGQPPVQDIWTYDGRSALAGARSLGGKFPQFVAGMAGATKIAFRAITYDYESVDMVFDVTGASDAIAKVYADCRDVSPIAYAAPTMPAVPSPTPAPAVASAPAPVAPAAAVVTPKKRPAVKCDTCRNDQ